MAEAAIDDRDDWRPFCGKLYPPKQTAGDPMICTIGPHDSLTEKHLNESTGFSWWDTGS